MDKKILKNYVFNTINELLSILTPLIVTPYISRVLGADGVGVFSFTLSIVTYFVLFSLLGTATYGRRVISVNRDNTIELKRHFFQIMSFRFIMSLVAMIAYGVFISRQHIYKQEYLYFIIYIVGMIVDINWFFVGLEEFKVTVVRNMIVRISSIILVFLFVKKPEHVSIYILVFSLSTLLGNLSLWIALPRYISLSVKGVVNPFLITKDVIVLFLPTIAASIYTVMDKSMLGWIVGSNYHNGCYEQSEKIVKVAITIITSISTVISSRIAYNFSSGNKEEVKYNVNSTARLIWLLAVPILLGILIISDLFIPLFLGSGYEESVILMRIFSLLVIPISFSHLLGLSFLIQIKEEWTYIKAVCIASAANIIMNLLLIPLLKSEGAAIASVTSEMIGLGYMVLYCRKNKLLKMKGLVLCSKNYWFAGLIMSISMILFRVVCRNKLNNNISLVITIIIAIIVYYIGLVALKDEGIMTIFALLRKKNNNTTT